MGEPKKTLPPHPPSLFYNIVTRAASDSVHKPSPVRSISEDQGPLKTKDQSPNPDKNKTANKKSSDSRDEAEKDIILI